MCVLGLSGTRGFSGSDRPDGLVGDDGLEKLFRADSGQSAAQLRLEDLFFASGLSFLECFADAEDWFQLIGMGREHLLVDEDIGFSKDSR